MHESNYTRLEDVKAQINKAYLQYPSDEKRAASFHNFIGIKDQDNAVVRKSVEVYWGKAKKTKFNIDFKKDVEFESIGLCGLYLIPLYEASKFIWDDLYDKKLTCPKFSKELVTPFMAPPVPSLIKKSTQDKKFELSHLFNRSRRSKFPKAELSGHILEASFAAFATIVAHADIWLVKKIIDETRPQKPGDIFANLVHHFHRDNKIRSWIDPQLISDKPKIREGINENITNLKEFLYLGPAQKQVAIISGPSFCGKTVAIKCLLTDLGVGFERIKSGKISILESPDPSKARLLSCETGQPPIPVFAIACKDLTITEIITAVYNFMYPAIMPNQVTNLGVTAMIKAIRARAQTPALFVFCNLNLYFDDTAIAVQDHGVDELLASLCNGNSETRVIISAQKKFAATGSKRQTWHSNITNINADPNKVSNLKDYLDTTLWKQFNEIIEADYPKSIAGLLAKEASGAKIIAFCGVCEILKEMTPEFIKLFLNCVDADINLRNSDESNRSALKKNADSAESEFHIYIWSLVEDNVVNPHLRRALALLTVVDDGFVKSSLKNVLETWEALDKADCALDVDTIFGILDLFCGQTHSRLFRMSEATRILEYERLSGDSYDKSVIIDPPVRQKLSDALRVFDPSLYSIANMFIAGLARQRSKKSVVNSHGVYGLEGTDMRREYQFFGALIAGVLCDGSPTTVKSVRNIEKYVTNPKNAGDTSAILQYAYRVVLKQEIDLDNRLTLARDDDALRLQLYLSLFHIGDRFSLPPRGDLGRCSAHSLFNGGFSKAHENALSLEERAEILQTIAISAVHAWYPDIAQQACKYLEELLVEKVKKKPGSQYDFIASSLIRARCYLVECEIMGYHFDGKEGDRNKQLLNAKRMMESELLELASGIGLELLRLKSQSRIRHRILRVKGLLNPSFIYSENSQAGQEINLEIRRIVSESDSVGDLSKNPSGNYGGRTGRMLLETMIGNPAFRQLAYDRKAENKITIPFGIDVFDQNAKKITDDTIENKIKYTHTLDFLDSVINATITRLFKYSGGERANIIICEILRDILIGRDFANETYDEYRNLVRDHLMFPGVSPALRSGLSSTLGQLDYISGMKVLHEKGNMQKFKILTGKAMEEFEFLENYSKMFGFVEYEARSILMITAILLKYKELKIADQDNKRKLSEIRPKLKQVANQENLKILPKFRDLAAELLKQD